MTPVEFDICQVVYQVSITSHDCTEQYKKSHLTEEFKVEQLIGECNVEQRSYA